MLRLGSLACLTLAVSACTWVKLTEAGKTVDVKQADEVGDCRQVGKITSVSLAKVAGVKRGQKKLATELQSIARNEAVDMNGNTIVAAGDIAENEQPFLVYHCP